MRKMLHYLRPYRKESILGPLFKLLEVCFELIVPLVMASIIDIGIANRDVSYIWKMAALIVGLGVFGFASAMTAQYFAAKAAVGLGTTLRREVFGRIMRFPYDEIDRFGASTLVVRMTADINQVETGVNLGLRLLLRSPFIIVGAMIMAFIIYVKLALIFLLVTPVVALAIFLIMRATVTQYKKIQETLDRVSLITRENLSGVRVIRAFARQAEEVRKFEETGETLAGTQRRAGRVSGLLNPVNYMLANLAIVAILWFGGIDVNLGSVTQGQVIALVNYMTQVLLSLIVLANLIISLTRAAASAGRISKILEVETPPQKGAAAVDRQAENGCQVECRNVSFRYGASGEYALEDLSFSVPPGRHVGVIGGTGSGKTTLMNLLQRFYDVTEGSISLDGVDLKEYSEKQLRQLIGVVPQKAILFRGTLRENLSWRKPDAADEEMWEALRTAQAIDFVQEKGEGLDMLLEQGGRNLSGGQRQRLTIARALIGNPSLLILDDSASALDFATEARFRKALRAEMRQATIFTISQRIASIRNADVILVLHDGKIEGMGTHRHLLQTCAVYREIYSSQFAEGEDSNETEPCRG